MHNAYMAAAVVYVPAGYLIDRHLAGKYWTYLQRRGYKFHAVVRDMDRALDDLSAGQAQVVICVNPEADEGPRAEPGMTTVVDLAARRDKMMADEPTQRLRPCADQLLEDARQRWMKRYNQP